MSSGLMQWREGVVSKEILTVAQRCAVDREEEEVLLARLCPVEGVAIDHLHRNAKVRRAGDVVRTRSCDGGVKAASPRRNE